MRSTPRYRSIWLAGTGRRPRPAVRAGMRDPLRRRRADRTVRQGAARQGHGAGGNARVSCRTRCHGTDGPDECAADPSKRVPRPFGATGLRRSMFTRPAQSKATAMSACRWFFRRHSAVMAWRWRHRASGVISSMTDACAPDSVHRAHRPELWLLGPPRVCAAEGRAAISELDVGNDTGDDGKCGPRMPPISAS